MGHSEQISKVSPQPLSYHALQYSHREANKEGYDITICIT